MKHPDWDTVTVYGDPEEGFIAMQGQWSDGTPMTEDELDDLDHSKVYDIGYDNLIMKAEAHFEGDR